MQFKDDYNERVVRFDDFGGRLQQDQEELEAAKAEWEEQKAKEKRQLEAAWAELEREKAKSEGKKRGTKGSKIAAQRRGIVEPVAVPRVRAETGGRAPAGPSTAALRFSRLMGNMNEDARNKK